MSIKQKILCALLWILGIFCTGYFVMLMVALGPTFTFNYVWLVCGLFFLGLAFTFSYAKKGFYWMPKPMIIGVEVIVFLGLFLFVAVESLIIKQSVKKPSANADYIIVLGAKINGTTPSHILQKRVEKAYEYLAANPDCKVVVSGGQGPDEGCSEAEAMHKLLRSLGIEEERILEENRSTNTKENLDYSKELLISKGINVEEASIVVVTTDFHVLRALGIARKCGFTNVEGLASKQKWYLIPTNYVREFLAMVKDFVVGNM
ncbi:MAG: YdcF family protein [Lachnospiraceae bacterium]